MGLQIEKTIDKWTEIYKDNKDMDLKAALENIEEAAAADGEHVYAANLKLLQSLGQYLSKHYRECGLSEELADCALEDIRWKTRECEVNYGVEGIFVPWWYDRFLNVTRFTLGRLQFEEIDTPKNCPLPEGRTPKDTPKLIGVHIPSAGKLNRQEYLDSYRAAVEFFGKYFHMERPLFYCESWMLTPAHEEILPPESNILQFQRDFHIYNFEPGYGDLWRIFNREYDGHPKNLPENTTLQRIYKNWLLNGGIPGMGEGILNPREIL